MGGVQAAKLSTSLSTKRDSYFMLAPGSNFSGMWLSALTAGVSGSNIAYAAESEIRNPKDLYMGENSTMTLGLKYTLEAACTNRFRM
jgi:hypothetical protein